MPVLLLIGLALVYQMFFRYETDVRDPDGPGPMAAITYEKDTLTGSIHRLKAGEKRNIIQRLLGTEGESVDSIPGDPGVTQGSEQDLALSDNSGLSAGDIPPESDALPSNGASRQRIEPNGQVSVLSGRRPVTGLRLQPLDPYGNTAYRSDNGLQEDLGTNWEIPPEPPTNNRGFLQGRVSEATALRRRQLEQESGPPVPGLRTRRAAPAENRETPNAPTPSRAVMPHLTRRITRNIVAPAGVNSGKLAFHNQPDDLNADGSKEEIIETPTGDGDWVDISVVSGGKEVFNVKGKRLIVLPRRHHGWSDLAISTTDGSPGTIYRYNPTAGTYAQTGLPLPGG